jgi:hypothetical protein
VSPSSQNAPRLLVALALAAMAIAAVVRWVLLVQPIGGDPGIYAYVGARILAGDVPYRDVFEQKPPGILYTYAGAFWALGRSMLAVQAADFVAWLLTVAAVFATALRIGGDRTTGWVAAALAAVFVNPTLQSGFKQVGQAETWIGLLATAALFWSVGPAPAGGRRDGSGRAWLAGLACGLACVYKFNAVPYAAAALATLTLAGAERGRTTPGRVVPLILGVAAPLAGMCAYFIWHGALRDLVDATVLYNLRYAGDSIASPEFVGRAAVVTYRFVTMNVLWLAGAIGVLVILWRGLGGDRRPLGLVAFLLAAYAAILINAKFYPQYFLQILPLLAVAAAVGLVAAGRGLRNGALLGRLAGVTCLALVALPLVRHTAFDRLADRTVAAARYASGSLSEEGYFRGFGGYDDGSDFSLLANVRLARLLRESTAPDETVYIYGGEALVLFLADRRSPSRFVWNDPFLTGGFAGHYTEADLVRELDAARTPPTSSIPPTRWPTMRRRLTCGATSSRSTARWAGSRTS